jgi:hypothetical protein
MFFSIENTMPNSSEQLLGAGSHALAEPVIGYNFSRIPAHAVFRVKESARKKHARLFTAGHDIGLNRKEYARTPKTAQRGLNRELIHLVQQRETDRVNTLSLSGGGQTNSLNLLPARSDIPGHSILRRKCKGTARSGSNEIISSAESDYKRAVEKGNYCRDSGFTGFFHRGKRCYREVAPRQKYTHCPPGDQVCFSNNNKCVDSQDKISPVAQTDSDGSCILHPRCAWRHGKKDVLPWLFGSPGRGALAGLAASGLVGAGIGAAVCGAIGSLVGLLGGGLLGAGIGALIGWLRKK